MLKGSEIHHSQSLPAQKASHLRGTSTMPHLPRCCVIFAGINSNRYYAALSPVSGGDMMPAPKMRRAETTFFMSQSQQTRKLFGWSKISSVSVKKEKFVITSRTEVALYFCYFSLKLARTWEVQTICSSVNMDFEYNDRLRAIIHFQSNLVLCPRPAGEAAMTF